ncbi:MAG: lipoprotein [Burkholderiales bacterium]|nr:lipoprotein [Burkholderiales bacterium]MDE1927775.1 lipoprotein [Burkholderiales bacterium]MDE2160258.1 lipoprotein [Burkholderiales bacterium]MDE2504039.1 lipoprotein [Burkholderiales bacterium]
MSSVVRPRVVVLARIATVAVAALSALAGCGQKGPLVLPAPAQAAPGAAPGPASTASAGAR